MANNNGSAGARPEPREPRAEARPEPRPAATPAAPAPRVEQRPVEAVSRPAVPEPKPAHVPSQNLRASVLGPTLKFRGELSAQEDLVVQGSVEGSITHTQTLTIGTEGSMKGGVRARVIIIEGKVEGDLHASESLSIRATAKVKGNLFAPRVAISDGAFFQGQIDMQSSLAAAQEAAARAQPPAPAVATPTVAAPAVALEESQVDKILAVGGSTN